MIQGSGFSKPMGFLKSGFWVQVFHSHKPMVRFQVYEVAYLKHSHTSSWARHENYFLWFQCSSKSVNKSLHQGYGDFTLSFCFIKCQKQSHRGVLQSSSPWKSHKITKAPLPESSLVKLGAVGQLYSREPPRWILWNFSERNLWTQMSKNTGEQLLLKRKGFFSLTLFRYHIYRLLFFIKTVFWLWKEDEARNSRVTKSSCRNELCVTIS